MSLAVVGKIVFLALILGLDAFAISIAIGAGGVTRRQMWRVGLVFGAFESLMPLLGMGVGRVVAGSLGQLGPWVAFAALVGVGAYTIREALAARGEPARTGPDLASGMSLVIAAVTVSLDALGVGFGLALLGLPIVPALVAIALAGFALTAAGLLLGARLGAVVGDEAQVLAGVFLIVAAFGLAGERLFLH